MSTLTTFDSVRDFCLHVLESPDLEAKLTPPLGRDGKRLFAAGSEPPASPGAAVLIDRPVRSDRIRIGGSSDKLPYLHELRDPHARAVCLERFANHELMAVELFAWALLAYPQMPAGLRRGLLHVLEEEQGHVRLYLDRLTALGSGLGQSTLSDYFWQQVPGIKNSSNGPAAFLCVMGLTLEQANLDFSLLYRDAFRDQGDEESARAMHQVHLDEIGHVRLAARWLTRVAGSDSEPSPSHGQSPSVVDSDEGRGPDPAGGLRSDGEQSSASGLIRDVDAYARFVPFPLSAARAKGRRFDVAARRRAGLSEEFIEYVRRSKPYENLDPSEIR